jgi:hypothetical protein
VPKGALSVLERIHPQPQRICPADLFRALAPERALPTEFARACDASRAEPLPTDVARRLEPAVVSSAVLTGADYCGANGASNFVRDACNDLKTTQTDELRSYYCISELWGWHDRAMTWQLGGEEGDYGEERVAACGGSIRFRAFWRWDVGDSWITSLDVTIGSGGRYTWYIAETGGGEDIDVRFKVDSAGGTHRHAGLFVDW